MKYIIIVGDGMADRPIRELGGKTPLEAAKTPKMDEIARKGRCGMVKHFYKGMPLDSGVANLSILGYDPRKYYSGRGPLEAVNIGVKLNPGDIAMRFNFITVEDGRITDPFSGHITNDETKVLVEELRKNFGREGVEFYQGVSYRNLLVLRSGAGYSMEFESTPPHDITGEDAGEHMVKAKSEAGRKTADFLNNMIDESARILGEHPVNRRRIEEGKNPGNMIWVQGAGVKTEMPQFNEKYKLTGALISAVDLLKGMAREIGLEVINVPGATGYLDTNYEGKADAALKVLEEKDFVFTHIESTDESGHEGIVEHKIRALEDLDSRVVGRIMRGLRGDYRIAITADHPTPIELRTHSDDPVPFAIYDSSIEDSDDVERYTEREVMEKGSLGSIIGYEFMNLLVRRS
ncbi:MAG: cofactor-independent phosphoglycerate mutase [Candidatus Altiarchaeota archaeon]